MRINLVCVEDGIISVGFRKMVSYVKSLNPDTQGYFVAVTNSLSMTKFVLGTYGEIEEIPSKVLREIAEPLAQGDIIGFSSMTGYAEFTKKIIEEVRLINPKIYVIWGGIHPIIQPEDAILSADAICVGEGEFAFRDFLKAFMDGRDFYGTKNFWFNKAEETVQNDFLPLATAEEMDRFPLPMYEDGELLFKPGQGFVPMSTWDNINFNGLAFNTIWSIGCPYTCSFCGNTKFIENDKYYRKLRHPSVDYLILQIKDVVQKHPFVSSIIFHDDSFMAIPKAVLWEFADKWKTGIDLPFCVMGVIPSFVKEDKFEVLVDAGMNRVRMGIQSGSDRILDFYKRPNKPGLINHATTIISKFNNLMIPPSYDIILDNPIEKKEDVEDTLKLLYDMARPFTLNVFSLRVIPNSHLEQQLKELEMSVEDISGNYIHVAPILSNIMVYLLAIWRPPRKLFEFVLKRVKPYHQEQPEYPTFLLAVRFFYLLKRAIFHLKFMDFSVIRGKLGWFFWKIGLIKLWRQWGFAP